MHVFLLTITHKTISLINANFQILNLNRPYKFVKLTTREVRIQTFEILTQRHSCALNGCSGAVPTHSLVFMCTHKHSGWDFVTFDSNRPIGNRDRIFGEESIHIELDFVKPIVG